jgi:hypothetical protein
LLTLERFAAKDLSDTDLITALQELKDHDTCGHFQPNGVVADKLAEGKETDDTFSFEALEKAILHEVIYRFCPLYPIRV